MRRKHTQIFNTFVKKNPNVLIPEMMPNSQGVRIHSTPRIHSFSNWGVGVVHSFFRVVFGVGVNPYNFSIHSTTPFIKKF